MSVHFEVRGVKSSGAKGFIGKVDWFYLLRQLVEQQSRPSSLAMTAQGETMEICEN